MAHLELVIETKDASYLFSSHSAELADTFTRAKKLPASFPDAIQYLLGNEHFTKWFLNRKPVDEKTIRENMMFSRCRCTPVHYTLRIDNNHIERMEEICHLIYAMRALTDN